MDIAGYEDLRREQAEKRATRRADGHRRLVLHRGRRRRPAQAHGHPRAGDERRRRPARAPVRQGRRVALSAQTQGQGHETTFAQIVAEELGIPPEDVEVRHGDTDKSPYGLGTYGSRSTPVSGAAVAVVSRKVRDKARADRGHDARDAARGPRLGEGPLVRQGRPASRARSIVDIAERAYSGDALPEGMEGGLDAQVIYDPPNLTYPYGAYIAVVDIDPETARGQGPALHRGRRLRRADQPDDRRGPDPRRPRRGRRDRADGGDHVRRGGQLPQRLVHGLPDPDRARVPGLRARRDRHAVPAPPARGQGRRRVAERRARRRRSSTR